MKKQIKITIMPNGSLKIDATKMPGTSAAILKELQELAELVGGDMNALVIEKHVHGAHTHTHDDEHEHTHA